jgi:N-acetyltransferase
LTLRPLQQEDFQDLFAAASDPQIWEMHPQPDRYTEPMFRDFFETGIASRGALVVLDNSTGQIVGSSRYYALDPDHRTVTVGYTFLARRYWGNGYNREIKKLMLDHAFRSVEIVRFEVGEINLRSQRALEKIGAQLMEKTRINEKPYLIYEIRRPHAL